MGLSKKEKPRNGLHMTNSNATATPLKISQNNTLKASQTFKMDSQA